MESSRKYLVTVARPAGGEISLTIVASRALYQPEVRRVMQSAGYALKRFEAADRRLERVVERAGELHHAPPPI
jgi:hypothetical protein